MTASLNRLAAVWLLVMAAAVFGPRNIAALYPDGAQIRAAAAWNYVLDHAVGGLAAATLLALAHVLKLWKSAPHLVAMFLWLALEEVESSVCRLAFPMDKTPPKTGQFSGLCDIATGLPIYWMTLGAVFLWLLVLLQQRQGRK